MNLRTILVVILTEVMVFWFKDIEFKRIIMFIALVIALIVARVLAIWFSPARAMEGRQEKNIERPE
ncbi:MAG: hypothetical protein AABZ23_03825 [Deltaproteobacteria bacterium]